MKKTVTIGNKKIGDGNPTFILAEMSGNHNMEFERASQIVRAAKEAGADAVKLQTYTADTITLNSDKPCFQIGEGSLWEGMTLHKLYEKAFTPWEWQPKLKKLADDLGILLFSSPFDETAVDFLEEMNVPAYKIASFEITDIQLLRKVARTGKPIIMSTGVADMGDIQLAISTCQKEGNDNIVLLKCTSEYPAPFCGMNIKTIPNMKETFGVPAGLSDHSLGDEVPLAAVALGANVIEKHFTLNREDGGVDAAFSMDIAEMKNMVRRIRNVEQALGEVSYEMTEARENAKKGARSLFASKDIKKGEIFTKENVKSVRPGIGLHTKYFDDILGKRATKDIEFAEPLGFGDIEW